VIELFKPMLLLGILGVTGGVLAQPPTKPAAASTVLAGPRVPAPNKPTLIERDSDGTIRRTDAPPEVAALRLLEIPDSVRRAVDDVLHRRARFIEKFIEKNLDLLSKLDTAGQTGDKLDQAILGLEAIAKLAPLTRDGSLKKQIRALLPMEHQQRFDALLKEYWDAIVTQERTKNPDRPRFEIIASERVQSLTREITAAVQGLEKSGVLLYGYFFSDMKLAPGQEAEIRALLDEFVEKTKGSPTQRQEAEIFITVLSKLTLEQQTEVIRRFKAREGPQPKQKPKTPPTPESEP
jgi:hypothetical protein